MMPTKRIKTNAIALKWSILAWSLLFVLLFLMSLAFHWGILMEFVSLILGASGGFLFVKSDSVIGLLASTGLVEFQ